MLKRYGILFLAACSLTIAASCPSALAMTAAPGWEVVGRTLPTNLPPGGEGVIRLYVYNVGAASAEGGILTDVLPEGLTATEVELVDGSAGNSQPNDCSGTTVVTCTLQESPEEPAVRPAEDIMVFIHVNVANELPTTGLDHVSVVGGGALQAAESSFPVTIGSTAAKFGFAAFDVWASNADGTIDRQAGSHPYELTVAFGLNAARNVEGKLKPAGGELRNIDVNLPPGIIGNPQVVPQCPRQAFQSSECPSDTQIGMDWASVSFLSQFSFPVFNLVPPRGIPAQFGFQEQGNNVFLDAGVRTGGDNGITEHSDNLPEREIFYNTTTVWGVPADPSHDYQRTSHDCEKGCADPLPPTPFLTLPTSCQGPQTYTAQALGTWEDENATAPEASVVTHDSVGNQIGFTGCEQLAHFEPSLAIAPDTTFADTPAGLSVTVRLPQGLNPEGLATSGLQNTTVTLPEGIAINPGQATGLTACQPSQEALGTEPDGEVNEQAPSCPASSRVGSDEITTPLLTHPLKGNIYVLQANPPNLQLLMTASGEGVNLKLVGTVHLDEATGQLTTTFEQTPDVPFTEFTLSFSGGAQAALATPTACGVYQSTADFTPWAGPFIEDALDVSRFQITAGPGGSACTSPMPFAPTMTAGATTDQAGGYTSFTMLLQRGDGQQRVKSLSFKTPEGLLGMISKVPLCGEPQAAQGSCSTTSQIGHTVVGAGPGPFPFYIPQASAPPASIYLTGPYKGAPFGLSIVVPLIAGPFNLGTEIVRAKIEVDRHTSQITVVTDPLPTIVKGIPADLRSIDAVIDRPEFMFNPTDCAPMSFSGTATSTEGASAPLSSHFQMGSCQSLKFQPNFKVLTSGKTSRANGASLDAKIVYPVGNLGFNQASSQSNIQSVKVDLPRQLPSRLTTLQKACPAATFEANPGSCPAASIVGHAKAVTPVLPVALEGPAYFVSHGGEEFPNLIVVLQGEGVTVDLVGDTFINGKTNVTSSTFKQVPDVPIASFELVLPQGRGSALAANGNLCKIKLRMPTAFTAQDGAVIHQSTPIGVTGCGKAKKAKKPSKHKKKK
jgi:hypothetical protein